MKIRISLPLISVVTAAMAIAVAVAQSQTNSVESTESDIEKAVLGTNARMAAAINRLDIESFFSYILDTDKGSIAQNGTVFKSRQEAKDAVKQGMMGVKQMQRRFLNPRVTVVSPDAALLTSEGSYTATLTDGRSMDGRFAVSLLFVRKSGEWKLLHGHYSEPARM